MRRTKSVFLRTKSEVVQTASDFVLRIIVGGFRFIPCAFRSIGRCGGDGRNIRARRAYVRRRSHSHSRILRR